MLDEAAALEYQHGPPGDYVRRPAAAPPPPLLSPSRRKGSLPH